MRTKRLTRLALLSAVALGLYVLEAQLPNPIPVAGVKLGLSKIVSIYTLFAYGPWAALGVLLTEWLRSHFTPLPGLPHWRQLVLVVECGGLLLVSLLPVGPLDWLANVIVSFVSAMQIESFRKFEGNPFSTTMCTGNLRSGTEKLYRCLFLREERAGRGAQDYYSVILLFVLGALVGGLCADLLAGRSILLACLPLSLAFLLMLREPQ